ncbi:uncharacterized protein LOC123307572 [Coccinella septempunctata]|uniref:uncharacterized protein LOC123307572 n=1 Tax=Coccinella septempunctata TaxID=41139 RepID=UPI001D08C2A2|nr:uncharacterized protein LOC123307572 [Coccinella septempunctata]
MWRYLVLFCVISRVQCGFFDLTDVDDPLALFWNTKQTLEVKGTCTVTNKDGGSTEGKCIHATKCLFTGGTSNGFCGLGGTCCTYKRGCNRETKEKVSYFSGTYEGIKNYIQSNMCTYKVNLLPNTCQVRLDFEHMVFNPPLWNEKSTSYKCTGDSLTVLPNYYNIPILCGNNNKQHAYIHLNRSIDSAVTLSIALADRSNSKERFEVSNPSWNIKVTQLECEAKVDVFHHNEKSLKDDLLMLAPLGAIQYFTQMSGNFRSFGLDENVVSDTAIDYSKDPYVYINNLAYAIAFKRYPSICGVRLTPLYMTFSDDAGAKCDKDYIFAPEATDDSKWCDGKEVSIFPPGPLYIYFTSPSTYTSQHTKTWGFNIDYHLESCSSQLNKIN